MGGITAIPYPCSVLTSALRSQDRLLNHVLPVPAVSAPAALAVSSAASARLPSYSFRASV